MTHSEGTIRILIGAGPDERVPALVLEHTIRKHVSGSVEFIHTFDRERPGRGRIDKGGHDPTDFSFVRLWIPELCGRAGRCIYLDSDMMVFADIREIWDIPMEDNAVIQTPPDHRTEVLVIDCGKCAGWDAWAVVEGVRNGTIDYATAIQTLMGARKASLIPQEWNHTDTYDPHRTKLLHFTRLHQGGGRYNSQPWTGEQNHPLGHLWWRECRELGLEKDIPDALHAKGPAGRFLQRLRRIFS